MAKREFAVFGLGKFGRSVATTLAASGCEVIAIDINEEKVEEVSDVVTVAVKADVTDNDALQALGIRNVDVAFVTMSEDLEASIMATILAKEFGVSYVIAKASNELHGTVLRKVGADEIVFPEKEMGARIARTMMAGNFIDLIELSSRISIVEMEIPKTWVGKTLRELNIRDRFGVNLIALKLGDRLDVNVLPDTPLEEKESIVVVGDTKAIHQIR
ncbi:potassium channel family protein [Anaerosacchariphilus polymeriproducens]|uniref:TrkA family potassium uptake protein n=1 Tax=Anaerosacchariphilus polymeriproducens TaxID=1812858 RepID=A0A371AXA8_9FIRM|nr:TrkA family potassium uptake protein [Anaerosacchariphilus polymeriproducens]RDU24197.1 TrkA family potassium uptake protein [Anaerosacchariphilus polymeriproducens]